MLRKVDQRNQLYQGDAPLASVELEREGGLVLRGVFSADEVAALRAEIAAVYERVPPDLRSGRTSLQNAAIFRYEMFNRSELCQRAIARRDILDVVEPLLGEDCHVINCTSWRNPAVQPDAVRGQEWHIDGGPHVPRPPGVPWPEAMPYPIFVVGTHIHLDACTLADGPTATLPGSHRSGTCPPTERMWDVDLTYEGRGAAMQIMAPGDVGFFVSDVWHRRMPPGPDARGRFFLQTNYGRREIAQRVRPTTEVHHVAPEALRRCTSDRERRLLGIHEQVFYDG